MPTDCIVVGENNGLKTYLVVGFSECYIYALLLPQEKKC